MVEGLLTMHSENHALMMSLSNSINNLIESNNQIRLLLSRILTLNTSNARNQRTTDHRNTTTNLSRLNRRSPHETAPHYIYTRVLPENNLLSLFDGSNNQLVNFLNNTNNATTQVDNTTANLAETLLNSFLQPIDIYPSQQQIERSTRNVRYSDIVRPVNDSCPISREMFQDDDIVTLIRHCGHIFHTNNIMRWFQRNTRCPVCRYDIREYNSVMPDQTTNENRQYENTTENINTYSNNDVTFDASGNYVNNLFLSLLQQRLNNN
jgi:hypothetical protein